MQDDARQYVLLHALFIEHYMVQHKAHWPKVTCYAQQPILYSKPLGRMNSQQGRLDPVLSAVTASQPHRKCMRGFESDCRSVS